MSKNNNINVYIIGGESTYKNAIQNSIVVDTLEKADIVILTGGADVMPALYNETKHPTTSYNPTRDINECEEIAKAIVLQLPILGICRGAQLATVYSGGKLIQNVRGQSYIHPVTDTHFKETYDVTSTHHQMMYPFNLKKHQYKILAFASELTKVYEGLPHGFEKPEIEPEIVYYPETHMLAVQGHPEHEGAPERFKSIVTAYSHKLLNNDL